MKKIIFTTLTLILVSAVYAQTSRLENWEEKEYLKGNAAKTTPPANSVSVQTEPAKVSSPSAKNETPRASVLGPEGAKMRMGTALFEMIRQRSAKNAAGETKEASAARENDKEKTTEQINAAISASQEKKNNGEADKDSTWTKIKTFRNSLQEDIVKNGAWQK